MRSKDHSVNREEALCRNMDHVRSISTVNPYTASSAGEMNITQSILVRQSQAQTKNSPYSFPPHMIPGIVWALMPFIVTLNSLVVIAFIVNHRLRMKANYFVISLACSDFFVGAILMPFVLTGHALGAVLTTFTFTNSLLTLCGCTFDRYLAVVHPFRYKEILTTRRVYIILALCWVCPVVFTTLPEIWNKEKNFASKLPHRIFMGCLSFGTVFIALTLIFLYVRIFIIARSHVRAIRSLHRFKHAPGGKSSTRLSRVLKEVEFAKLFAAIAVMFFIFWLPVGYINIVDNTLLRSDLMPEWAFYMSFYTMWLSSLIDPILYALFTKTFRKTLRGWCLFWTSKDRLLARRTRYKSSASNLYEDTARQHAFLNGAASHSSANRDHADSYVLLTCPEKDQVEPIL